MKRTRGDQRSAQAPRRIVNPEAAEEIYRAFLAALAKRAPPNVTPKGLVDAIDKASSGVRIAHATASTLLGLGSPNDSGLPKPETFRAILGHLFRDAGTREQLQWLYARAVFPDLPADLPHELEHARIHKAVEIALGLGAKGRQILELLGLLPDANANGIDSDFRRRQEQRRRLLEDYGVLPSIYGEEINDIMGRERRSTRAPQEGIGRPPAPAVVYRAEHEVDTDNPFETESIFMPLLSTGPMGVSISIALEKNAVFATAHAHKGDVQLSSALVNDVHVHVWSTLRGGQWSRHILRPGDPPLVIPPGLRHFVESGPVAGSAHLAVLLRSDNASAQALIARCQ